MLFPSAMALAETFDTEHNHDRRLDLLGWYKALEDWQIDVDVVDGSIFKDQTADQYEVLVLAANDCYALDPDSELEQGIAAWVKMAECCCTDRWICLHRRALAAAVFPMKRMRLSAAAKREC